MEPIDEHRPHFFCHTPPRRSTKPLQPRILFPDEMSSGGGGGIPPWKKGLAGIGVVVLSWVIFRPLLFKLASFAKEKYESRSNHRS